MKYNPKYDLYVDDDLIIYYWSKRKDKLIQCPYTKNNRGYIHVRTKLGNRFAHRIIYETLVEAIPDGYEIDHINTIRTDNRLNNLRIVTHKDNNSNPLTLIHRIKRDMELLMKETTKKPKTEDKDVKRDLTEIKITLAIMAKQIEFLENKLKLVKPELNPEDSRELWEMTHNRSK